MPPPSSSRDSGSAAVLDRICASVVRRLPVDGSSVSARTLDGHHGPVSVTDETIGRLGELEFALGEGPGVEAFRDREPVLVPDLRAGNGGGQRWPVYSVAALQLGARAVMAFPLLLGAADIGVLSMYAARPTILEAGERATALRLAQAGALALLDVMRGPDGSDAMSRTATRSNDVDGSDASEEPGIPIDLDFFRPEVYQAAGMAKVQMGTTIEVALARMRGHAFANDMTITEVARAIVRRELRMEPER